ncbi:MAG: ABC transporter permease [Chloroflexi bacterium]|nr:ABC transporter permease [Chloroflexota bacterium]
MARTEQLRSAPRAARINLSTGVWESVRIALESLRSNKLRTFLTMLGIIIGVWSVVSLISIGNGAQQAITAQVEGIGTNLLYIVPGAQQGGPGAPSTSSELTLDDVEAMRRSVPEAEYVTPMFQGSAKIDGGDISQDVQVTGVQAEYSIVRNLKVARGQFITEDMDAGARNVAVLGGGISEDIFGSSDPIGQSVRLNGQSMKVVGVLEKTGGLSNEDAAVYVPLNTGYKSLFGGRATTAASYRVSNILMQARTSEAIDLAQEKTEQLMRRRHKLDDSGKDDDFTVFSQASLLSTFNTVTTTLTVFLGAIAGISLFVGGIGVMNIMLVSVTERTKEIGLRKAVGAKRRDILRQFLIEALVMSIMGGLIGLLLGYGTASLVGFLFSEYITPVVTLGAVMLAVGFSAAVGLFFGIYPALRAARLNPIQALRYE